MTIGRLCFLYIKNNAAADILQPRLAKRMSCLPGVFASVGKQLFGFVLLHEQNSGTENIILRIHFQHTATSACHVGNGV